MQLICIIWGCCMLFSGCRAAPAETKPTLPGAISKCIFSLPEGYIFVEESINSLIILKNGDAFGVLILTGLDVSCLEDTRNSEIHK